MKLRILWNLPEIKGTSKDSDEVVVDDFMFVNILQYKTIKMKAFKGMRDAVNSSRGKDGKRQIGGDKKLIANLKTTPLQVRSNTITRGGGVT
jgi:hypothetical protein